jgi:hypothetical protein
MSDVKTPKKETKAVKKTKEKEAKSSPDAGSASLDKTADKTADKSTDQSADKTAEKSNDQSPDKASEKSGDSSAPVNKSASQTSISHFSSVVTEEYRSGWANIFGGAKTSKKTGGQIGSKQSDAVDLPLRLKLFDEDIKDDLRLQLYEAFKRQARKDGVGLAKHKKAASFEYTLECYVSKK